MGNINITAFIITFAALQGVLLSILLVSAEKFRKRSNLALSLCLLSTSLIILQNAMLVSGFGHSYPSISYLPMRLTFLLSASIYFFIQYLTNPNYEFQIKDKLICIPVVLQITLDLSLYMGYFVFPEEINRSLDTLRIFRQTEEALSIVFSIVVFILALKSVTNYQKKLFDNYTSVDNQNLNWLQSFMYIVMLLWLGWCVFFFGHVTGLIHFEMYIVWIGMALTIYWLGYFMYFRRDIFEIPIFEKAPDNQHSKLSERTDEHFSDLLQLMETSKLYLDPELNMSTLAQKMALSNGYLSQIINKKEGKNFFDFVNSYRVNQAKSHLIDPKFNHYSILGIALESGFKSKSTFNSVFKRLVGLTPSAYKRSVSQ